MNITSLSLSSNILSMGALLGTSGSQTLIDQINAQCGGSSFFGSMSDPFRNNFQAFMSQVIQPIRATQQALATVASKLSHPDLYRPIESVEDLEQGIPPCMQLGIIYYHPLRKMLEEERIDGFGIDPKTLQEGDPYEDVLNSNFVTIHSSTIGKNGSYHMTHLENTDDPELTSIEKDALRRTREFIDTFMSDDLTKASDFTSYPNLHA